MQQQNVLPWKKTNILKLSLLVIVALKKNYVLLKFEIIGTYFYYLIKLN